MLRATESLRADLPRVLRMLGVKTLLDAPCGDLNWMRHVDLDGIAYIGADSNSENLVAASARAGMDERYLLTMMDIITDPLPSADAMLCRDFYQHLPNRLVWRALGKFVEASIPWLLATSHDNAVNKDIERVGDFRCLNLTAAPFGLIRPIVAIPDGQGRIVGVWRRQEVIDGLESSK